MQNKIQKVWFMLLSGLLLVAGFYMPSFAEDKYWVGSSGYWNDGSNWNPPGEPVPRFGPGNGDSAYLTQDDDLDRVVNYQSDLSSNNPPPNYLGDEIKYEILAIDAIGNGTITLKQEQGVLQTRSENIGINGYGSFYQSGGSNHANAINIAVNPGSSGEYYLSGGNIYSGGLFLGWNDELEDPTLAGSGTFTQIDGYNQQTYGIRIGRTSTFELAGGQLDSYGLSHVDGTFLQSGGSHIGPEKLMIGQYSDNAIYKITDGELAGVASLLIYSGRLQQDGGKVDATTAWVHEGGTYQLNGGQYTSSVNTTVRGLFSQNGGTFEGTRVTVDSQEPDQSTYVLNEGTVKTAQETIGQFGAGSFVQRGGINEVTSPDLNQDDGKLIIAENPGSSGTYRMEGGTLIADEIINNDAFVFTGGTIMADMTNNSDLIINGGGCKLFDGDIINFARTQIDQAAIQFAESFNNYGEFFSDNSYISFNDLWIYDDGYLQGAEKDFWEINGHLSGLDIQDDIIMNILGVEGMNIRYDPTNNLYLAGKTYFLNGGGYLSPTPEPATIFLLSIGVIGTGLLGRRKLKT